jgi:phosphoglycolate phosphatase
MKMKYDHVVWDFNGTVLCDMQVGIDCVNAMLEARGLPILNSLEVYREVFDFPVKDYYRRVGFDFEKEDYKTLLAPLWVSLYEQNEWRAPLFAGVEPLTSALRAHGIRQSILSASESGMMKKQLDARGALTWFDEIWGNDCIHAYGKEGLAAAWRAKHPDACAVVIGDTVHDFAVAQAMDADCILVAAGHHSYEKLISCGVPVVRNLLDCAALLLP